MDGDTKPCPVCGGMWIRNSAKSCLRCAAELPADPPALQATAPDSGIPGDTGCPPDAYEGKERELQALCEARLTSAGVLYPIHLPPTVRALGGLPDILAVWQGKHAIAIELKVRGGRVKPEQRECMRAMRADGWHVAVCWSLTDLDNFLKGLTP